MELTLVLSRVFGIYFLIAAVMVFANRKALMVGVLSMFKERFAQLIAAMIACLGGLLLLNLHWDWSSLPAGVITTLGLMILAKGLLYAFMPNVRLANLARVLTEKRWYTMDGVLALLVGLYLAGYGYGLW